MRFRVAIWSRRCGMARRCFFLYGYAMKTVAGLAYATLSRGTTSALAGRRARAAMFVSVRLARSMEARSGDE